MFKSKKEVTEYFRKNIGENTAWAKRALTVIFQYQTIIERSVGETTDHNGVGFTACDAELLTSFAKQQEAGKALSQRQVSLLKRMMPKYAGQLVDHSLYIGRLKKQGRTYTVVKA
jgi:hypothetical protein